MESISQACVFCEVAKIERAATTRRHSKCGAEFHLCDRCADSFDRRDETNRIIDERRRQHPEHGLVVNIYSFAARYFSHPSAELRLTTQLAQDLGLTTDGFLSFANAVAGQYEVDLSDLDLNGLNMGDFIVAILTRKGLPVPFPWK